MMTFSFLLARVCSKELAAAALGLAAASVYAQQPATTELADLPPLTTAPVVNSQDPSAIRVLLSPQVETTLVAQVAANVAELDISLGSTVEQGQVLLRFNCAETQARLRMSQAEYRAANETLKTKQNLQQLNAAGDIEVRLAKAELDRTAAAIAISKAQLDHCEVIAPFNGRVVKVHVKAHQGVNVGASLVELVSDGPLKLRLNVPSKLLAQLQIGTPLQVDIYETGQSYDAQIVAINARVDAVAQTIELEAHLDQEHDDLLAGMSGIARLPVQTP